MTEKDASQIVEYYFDISNRLELLYSEKEKFENEYENLKGVSYDGIHVQSSNSSNPVERTAIKAADKGIKAQIDAISVQIVVLASDRGLIRQKIDGLYSGQKRILIGRYEKKHSWVRIAMQSGLTETTARRWHKNALRKLAKEFDELPMVEEILIRAS